VMEVIVEDKQLSLAIGKKGQNVRLAAKLTGWKIDIKSEEEKRREVEKQFGDLEIGGGEAAAAPAEGEGAEAQAATAAIVEAAEPRDAEPAPAEAAKTEELIFRLKAEATTRGPSIFDGAWLPPSGGRTSDQEVVFGNSPDL